MTVGFLSEFWAVLIVPWVLDAWGGRWVLASAFGALLWGVAVVLASIRYNTKDPVLKLWQGRGLCFVAGAWLCYWGLSFFEAPQRMTLEPAIQRWFSLTHGTLLTAGAGMVVVLWIASLLWLLKEASLRRTSWDRRQPQRWKLPSLESLDRLCRRAARFAFWSWGLGFGVALVTGTLHWQGSWLADPKLLGIAAIGLLLAALFRISHRPTGRGMHSLYLGLSTVFLIAFTILMAAGSSRFHGPMMWFVP